MGHEVYSLFFLCSSRKVWRSLASSHHHSSCHIFYLSKRDRVTMKPRKVIFRKSLVASGSKGQRNESWSMMVCRRWIPFTEVRILTSCPFLTGWIWAIRILLVKPIKINAIPRRRHVFSKTFPISCEILILRKESLKKVKIILIWINVEERVSRYLICRINLLFCPSILFFPNLFETKSLYISQLNR